MKDQLKTIREALVLGIKAINHLGGAREAMPLHDALPALAQLEAMVGEQKPVAKLHDDGYWTPMKTGAGRALNDRLLRAGSPSIEVYTAAPVAQQPHVPEAGCGNITPAELAKRIERGEKWEVAQQPQAECWACNGTGTVTTSSNGSGLRDEPCANCTDNRRMAEAVTQPESRCRWCLTYNGHQDGCPGAPKQAEATDCWQQYAKDGETAQQCIERHRGECDATMNLLSKARAELGRAYRCIQAMHNGLAAMQADFPGNGYHTPTIAAAKRFVWEGAIDGSDYFIGKHVSVLHAALALPKEVGHG